MGEYPTTNGPNGRDASGRFGVGNPGGPGNPHAKRVAVLRSAMLSAVSEDDLRDIVSVLVREAKSGNVQAAREVLDRCLGKAEALDAVERVEALEALLESTGALRRAS